MPETERLPNFLIVGASKSGTSSLYHYLNQHPDIYLSERQKEGRFFSNMTGGYKGPGDSAIDATITRSLTGYKNLFAQAGEEKAVGDISPEYLFFYENAIPKIKEVLGENVKIIIILRSPVDRAFSGYMHFLRDKRETLSFEEGLRSEEKRARANWIWAWQYRSSGLYYEQVKAYLENFEQVQVILYDDFCKDAGNVLKEICRFLELDESHSFNTSYKYNVSGTPKSSALYKLESSRSLVNMVKKFLPDSLIKALKTRFTGENQMVKTEMNPGTRTELQRYFEKDIGLLEDLIGKDLSCWLK